MTRTDALRSIAVTIAAWCYVIAALSLYAPISEHWQHGGQRHASDLKVEIWR